MKKIFILIVFAVVMPISPISLAIAEVSEGMVLVKGGCFDMGDVMGDIPRGGRLIDEKPVHRVCLDDFYLDRHEVTNSEYERFRPGFKPSREAVYEHKKVSPGDNNPVVFVNWEDAKSYCRSLGKRLPTEAEWEYASREGGKKVRFGNGKNRLSPLEANFDPTTPFWYSKNGEFRGQTTPVESFPPNALGLYDMAGNVWEWLADWYDENYYKTSPENNPKGPEGIYPVVRGGSWFFFSYYQRASARGILLIWQHGFDDVGFRCARKAN